MSLKEIPGLFTKPKLICEITARSGVAGLRGATVGAIMAVLASCGGQTVVETDAAGMGPAEGGSGGMTSVDAGTGGVAGQAGNGGEAGQGGGGSCDKVLVQLAANTPQSSAVQAGSVNVHFTCLDFVNGCEDHELNSITVHRFGAGAVTDLNAIKLLQGAQTVGGPADLDQVSNEAVLEGTYMLPKFTTVNFCAAANISSNALTANQHGFEVQSADKIEFGEDVVAEEDFPVQGNLMTVVNP